MTRIVIGAGSSHTPQLSSGAQHWRAHGDRDRRSGSLVGPDGRVASFEELAAAAPARLADELTDDVFAAKFRRAQDGVAGVADALREAKPDVVLVVGDDQDELFGPQGRPALALYTGDVLVDRPPVGEVVDGALTQARMVSDDVRPALWAVHAEEPDDYAVDSALASYLAASLTADGFDPMVMSEQPEARSLGHAFTFVRRRLGVDRSVPFVPVLLNTYYPPNVPSPARCVRLGSALRAALDRWPTDQRVAVVASGGLSHFVVQEDLDRRVLSALADAELAGLASLPSERLRSGTSEILNWIVVAGMLADRRLDLLDYVAGFRSLAGTGVGMAFALWTDGAGDVHDADDESRRKEEETRCRS